MIVRETPLAGAVVLDLAPREDERGFFSRVLDLDLLGARGLAFRLAQSNLAYNHRRGTLRGMHFQRHPAAEIKLVRCTRGAIWDVIVDIREGSPTYGRHVGVELSAENRRTLWVPEGFAHGYQTLTDGAEIEYLVSARYAPEHEGGLRPTDPALAIAWPLPVESISPKDAAWPLLDASMSGGPA